MSPPDGAMMQKQILWSYFNSAQEKVSNVSKKCNDVYCSETTAQPGSIWLNPFYTLESNELAHALHKRINDVNMGFSLLYKIQGWGTHTKYYFEIIGDSQAIVLKMSNYILQNNCLALSAHRYNIFYPMLKRHAKVLKSHHCVTMCTYRKSGTIHHVHRDEQDLLSTTLSSAYCCVPSVLGGRNIQLPSREVQGERPLKTGLPTR